MSLSTFPSAWAEILEGALEKPFEIDFPDRPTAKKFQSQFYNLRRAMNRERPDLWEKYLELSFFLREKAGEDGKPITQVIIRKGHPLDEALATLGLKGRPWPDPPKSDEEKEGKRTPELPSDMEDTVNRLFGKRKED